MDESEKNNAGGNDRSPDDYSRQENSKTYYTPPGSNSHPSESDGTYHYSYNSDSRNRDTSGTYNPYGNTAQNTYGAPSPDGKPPKGKTSRAAKIIITVLVVCIAVAAVAIGLSVSGVIGNGSNSSDNKTSQSAGDTQLNDSQDVPLTGDDDNYTVAGVAKTAMDSCVGITVYSNQTGAYDFFNGYGQSNSSGSESTKSGEGSGVILKEADGKTYILTCAHVISEGDSFKVTLNDGTEYDAAMVGFDSQTDIGVLAIDATGLKAAEFADSDQLVVGEQVVAIGCPGGLEFMNSVTSGYISALDRPVSSSIGYDNECIQTDAAINPGNSGGALFNMQGQVIGINSSKIASTEYEGMGFAVPCATAVSVADSLIKVGYVEGRAKIGVTYNSLSSYNNASSIISALAQEGFEDAAGTMVISSVSDDSDLKNKDIQQYDMIVAVNGKTLTSTDVMTSVLSESSPGDTVKLTIARIENNRINTFEVDCKLIESKG